MLLKAGAAYPEMAAQEKSLDSLIELAKRDQLDENLPMDAIEKCCVYFATMFSVLFGECTAINQARLIVNGTRTLGNTCDAIATDAAAIKTLIQGDGSDIGNVYRIGIGIIVHIIDWIFQKLSCFRSCFIVKVSCARTWKRRAR